MSQATRQCRLPIGIQDFRSIRERNYCYVDKTALIRNLVDQGECYFLSRPPRFGKSLLLNTIQALFEGQEDLFRGLDIHPHWDWSVSHPVVRLGLGGTYIDKDKIDSDIIEQLESVERNHSLEPAPTSDTGPKRLRNVLDRLHRATGRQVVVLIDDYDKPILDTVHSVELVRTIHDYLRGIYGVIRDSARHVRFTFVTGVSQCSKIILSGLHHLKDISLDPGYAAICGYTDRELDSAFEPELSGLDRDEIRRWYGGYHWLGSEQVYNPFSILRLFDTRKFEAHWFMTGDPKALYDMQLEKNVNAMQLDKRVVGRTDLTNLREIHPIGIDHLMFQNGYLTIADESWDGVQTIYTLNYPNDEVSRSLNCALLEFGTNQGTEAMKHAQELADLLKANDFERFGAQLQEYLQTVSHERRTHNHGDRHGLNEPHYAQMVYMALRSIGLDVRVEDGSSRRRANLSVLHAGQVFVLEFKRAIGSGVRDVDETFEEAVAHMKECGYADKYTDRNEPIHLMVLAFGNGSNDFHGVGVEEFQPSVLGAA